MFHVHAWGFPYVATLLGAKQVYPGRFMPERILELIKREKVTFSHCVATILHMLINHPLAKEMDLRALKVNTGGMALPRGLAKTALEMGIELFHGYGMSETCPILTLANMKPHMMDWDMERQLDVRTKTGFPIPLVDLKITDQEGKFSTYGWPVRRVKLPCERPGVLRGISRIKRSQRSCGRVGGCIPVMWLIWTRKVMCKSRIV